MPMHEFYRIIRPTWDLLSDGKPRQIADIASVMGDAFHLSQAERHSAGRFS